MKERAEPGSARELRSPLALVATTCPTDPMIECIDDSIEYDECGEGATIVLAPGSCSTGAAWRPVVSQWRGGFRCITTSLLGYGRTAERRTDEDAGIALEAEVLETVIRRADCPVHLVGHSFGGVVGLAVALRQQVPLLSLTVLEAPVPTVLPALGELGPYGEFRAMTDAYFAAFQRGEAEAIRRMIDFFGGAGTFDAWPQRVRGYAAETTAVNIRDWATAYAFDLAPAMLAMIEIPTLVVWGGISHPAVRRANQLLSQCLPRASAVTLAGAAHFMIATHAEEVAGLVARHVTGRGCS